MSSILAFLIVTFQIDENKVFPSTNWLLWVKFHVKFWKVNCIMSDIIINYYCSIKIKIRMNIWIYVAGVQSKNKAYHIKASMNEFWTLLTLWYALSLHCIPVQSDFFIIRLDVHKLRNVESYKIFECIYARETRFCYLARNLACSVYWHINGMPQLIINYRKMTRIWHANCKCQDARH